jgi:kynurenine 3-monooxygenase
MMKDPEYKCSINVSDSFYYEFLLPPSQDGAYAIEKHALHIWPRNSFLMIGLPNSDTSYTCTLFFVATEELKFLVDKEEEKFKAFM